MLRNRGSRFDTGWLVTFSFFFILVEKNLLRNFLSVAKMASLVYERENCPAANRKILFHSLLIPEIFGRIESIPSVGRKVRGCDKHEPANV